MVPGRSHAWTATTLFVVALDAERSWYRYHHLFADVLHARLLAEQPDAAPALHRRATAWYADHDMLPEAIRHALLGGDAARAAHLVERAVPRTRRAREDATLLGWIGALPDDAVRRSPVLSLVAGWSMLMAGDLDATERRLDDADAALAAGEGDPELRTTWAETEDLRTAPATVSVYRAALAQARGDTAGTVDHARRALDLAAPDDHLVRGSAGGFLGLAAWAAGDVERAITTFSDAARSLRAAGNLVDALDSTVVLADMWLTAGRPEEARRLYDRALATATAQGEPYPRATADLHVGLAELDLERNDLDGAQAHLDTAKTLGERASITENRHRWYVAAARLRAATGDHAAATDLLDQAQALFRPGFYPDLRPIPAVRARVQIAAGDLESASRWAREAGLGPDDEPVFLREYELLTLVRLHLAQHVRSDQVLRTLRGVAAAAEPARAATLLEVGILAALARHAAGDTPGAVAELTHAAGRVPEPQSYTRLFLDEGAPMVALLGEAARAGDDPARRILGSARTSPPARTGGGPADPLSGRELDVLRMLASDLTGPEIARQLYVSLNTLRTHTKHIFTKLDVNTRAAAVRRGRALGLI